MSNIWQIVAALVVIVAVVYGLGMLARRVQGLSTVGPKNNKLVKVIESTYLGPKERLVMIEVGDEQVLLAINPQAISKVSTYSKKQFSAMLETVSSEA